MTGKKSGKQNLRGAIVGFGNIALKGHLPAYRRLGVNIVAAVDVCDNRLSLARRQGLFAFGDLAELKDLDLDFIDICTPPSIRIEPVRFAVENSLDVICEKPIATPETTSEIKNLVSDSDIFFFPVHNWKYSPHYGKVKEIVKENGGIEKLSMNTLRTEHSSGNPDWNPDWRVIKNISGGGIIMDHGYHNIYLAMHLFGSDFTEVVLEEVEYFNSNPEIERRAEFRLKFDDRIASIVLDWGAEKREIKSTIYECNQRIELSDKSVVNSDQTYLFDESLSGDSVHGSWFADVFSDFISKRNSKDKSHLYEAVKVLDGIESLYSQAKSSMA